MNAYAVTLVSGREMKEKQVEWGWVLVRWRVILYKNSLVSLNSA